MERQDIVNLLKTEEQLKDFICNHLYSDGVGDYVSKLLDARETLDKEFDIIISAKGLFDRIGVSVQEDEYYACISDISHLTEDLNACIDCARMLISDRIKTCDHEFEWVWSDSHHDYCQCNKCGLKCRY